MLCVWIQLLIQNPLLGFFRYRPGVHTLMQGLPHPVADSVVLWFVASLAFLLFQMIPHLILAGEGRPAYLALERSFVCSHKVT